MTGDQPKCPNCGEPGLLVTHHCADGGYVDVAHCGCFYDAAPGDVVYHVSRDCWCADRGGRQDGGRQA